MRRFSPVIFISFVLAVLRIFGLKHEAFQAAAHLWVGGLCGGWLISRDRRTAELVVVLSVIEVLCFVASQI